MRKEACKLAKKLADQNGGKPADYMKEAWDIVKSGNTKKDENIFFSRTAKRKYEEMENKKRKDGDMSLTLILKTAGVYLGKKALSAGAKGVKKGASKGKEGIKQTAKRGATDLNFMKAPADSPRDVIPDSIKDMFKFK